MTKKLYVKNAFSSVAITTKPSLSQVNSRSSQFRAKPMQVSAKPSLSQAESQPTSQLSDHDILPTRQYPGSLPTRGTCFLLSHWKISKNARLSPSCDTMNYCSADIQINHPGAKISLHCVPTITLFCD